MKLTTTLLNRNYLSKLFLTLALVVFGGGNLWGEEWTLTFTSGSDPSGWTSNLATYANGYFEPSAAYNYPTLTSGETKTITSSQKLVIRAKSDGNSGAYVYLLTSNNTTFSSTPTKKFEFKYYESATNWVDLVIDNTSIDSKYIQFKCCHASILSIQLVDDYELAIDEDNPTFLSDSGSKTIRCKYTPKDGWNTIIMPFPLTTWTSDHMTTIFGSGWKAYTIEGYSSNILSFTSIGSSKISANKPLLVYIENANDFSSSGYPLLTNISFTYIESSKHKATVDGVTFQGTYVKTTANYLQSIEAWGVDNETAMLRKAGASTTIKGYRAYFTGLPYNTATPARIITIDENGETTDLGFVKLVDPEAKEIYNLQGQRVEKGRKGIYIVNGKKVVIK